MTPDEYRDKAEKLVWQADSIDGHLLGDSERAARRASAFVYATLYAGTQFARLADVVEEEEAECKTLDAGAVPLSREDTR